VEHRHHDSLAPRPSEGSPISRRRFIALGPIGAIGAPGCSGLQTTASTSGGFSFTARPGTPSSTIDPGLHGIGLNFARDAELYVPKGYQPDRKAQLLVLLHGAGRSSSEWTSPQSVRDLLDELGIAMLAPSSRDFTWFPGGPDVAFIAQALAWTFRRLNVDPAYLWAGSPTAHQWRCR
jgi:poly(3-hydroxybutyrate) depolymerase